MTIHNIYLAIKSHQILTSRPLPNEQFGRKFKLLFETRFVKFVVAYFISYYWNVVTQAVIICIPGKFESVPEAQKVMGKCQILANFG